MAASPSLHNLLMNRFVERYSTAGFSSQLRRAQRLTGEEDECSDTAWGSEAGFGTIIKGSPSFMVPNVPDVRSHVLLLVSYWRCSLMIIASSISPTSHK